MSNIITEPYLKIKCSVCNATREILLGQDIQYEKVFLSQWEFYLLHCKCSESLLNAEAETNGEKDCKNDGNAV